MAGFIAKFEEKAAFAERMVRTTARIPMMHNVLLIYKNEKQDLMQMRCAKGVSVCFCGSPAWKNA